MRTHPMSHIDVDLKALKANRNPFQGNAMKSPNVLDAGSRFQLKVSAMTFTH